MVNPNKTGPHKTGSPQRRIVGFVREFQLEHGYPPTYQEIAVGIGLAATSKSSIHRHLRKLARDRRVVIGSGVRAIELVPQSPVLSIELPPHLFAAVQAFAAKSKVTPEAVVIEAVRDGFAAFHSRNVPKSAPRETSLGIVA